MKPDLQRQLVRRVLGHLEHRTTDAAARPSTLPVASYVDPDGHERERTRLFRELPLVVGHTSQLAARGDFITHDASGVPLLVVRGDDGRLAAFLNVCRHRGTRVEAAACGTREAFVCPYHAWRYARDGRLQDIPHDGAFAGLDREARGLVRVPAGELAGLVFVRPVPRRELSLDAELAGWLGPIASNLAGFGVPALRVHAPTTMVRQLSWKLAIEVFLESYDLRAAHLVDPIGAHQRHVFPRRTFRELAALPETQWDLRRHASLLFHVFPNTLVLVEPSHAAVLHMWPHGPARTLVTAYTLVAQPPVTEDDRGYWAANNAVLYGAISEDLAKGESVQLGLSSGANREIVFGAFEHALAHFHAEIARRVDGGTPEAVELDRPTAPITAPHAVPAAPVAAHIDVHSGPHTAPQVATLAAPHTGPHGRPAELRVVYDTAQRGGSTSRSSS